MNILVKELAARDENPRVGDWLGGIKALAAGRLGRHAARASPNVVA